MQIRGMSVDEYLEKIKAFHGHLAPGMVCGGFMVELAYRSLPEDGLFDAIAETRACLPDAIQVLTPCTVGNGWLRIVDTGRFAIALYDKTTGRGVRVALDPDRLQNWPETRVWAMKLKPKKEQDKQLLFSEIIEAGPKLYKIEPIVVERERFPKKGKIFTCDACGESFRGSAAGTCDACRGEAPFFVPKVQDRISPVSVDEAVGKTALHDMTRILAGVSKEPSVSRGDTLQASDVDLLKSMGKRQVYVMENAPEDDDFIHENQAALAFAEHMAGRGVTYEPVPREGKIDFTADVDGLFCVDSDRLTRFNRCEEVMCASRFGFSPVTRGMTVAGTRAIPLHLSYASFDTAMAVLAEGPMFTVAPYLYSRMGIVVTGSEVAEGRVQDGFTPIFRQYAQRFGLTVTGSGICPDDRAAIAETVKSMIADGAEVIVVTGGLSVDPDDVTRAALQDAGLVDEVYGAPVLPGAMTLTGRIGNARIIGVPAGALYFDRTAFDLLFPRILADLPVTRADMASLAEGGFLDAGQREI